MGGDLSYKGALKQEFKASGSLSNFRQLLVSVAGFSLSLSASLCVRLHILRRAGTLLSVGGSSRSTVIWNI
jgi:hypothetical protein